MENSEDLPTTFKSVKSRSLLHYGMMWHVEVAASITSQEDVTSWWQMILIAMYLPGQATIIVPDMVNSWISNVMPCEVRYIKIFIEMQECFGCDKLVWNGLSNTHQNIKMSKYEGMESVVHLLTNTFYFSLQCEFLLQNPAVAG